jgi:hypothetical protein
VPDIHGLIQEMGSESLQKYLPLCLILAIRSGLRNFKAKIMVMQPAHHGAITDFMLEFLPEITMKFYRRPMELVG